MKKIAKVVVINQIPSLLIILSRVVRDEGMSKYLRKIVRTHGIFINPVQLFKAGRGIQHLPKHQQIQSGRILNELLSIHLHLNKGNILIIKICNHVGLSLR